MRRLYLSLGWGIVLLGLVHMVATGRYFSELTGASLWFFSGGMMIALVGALNLLHSAYGRIALALRVVCIGTNAVATVFGAVSGTVNQASVPEFVLVLGLFGGATVLSVRPGSLAERAGLRQPL